MLNVYLSGEIHSDWRQEIIKLCKKENLNISFSDTQLVLSMYFLSLAIGQLISGPLSDKFGRRPIIILGSIIYSFGAFSCLFMSDIKLLVISKVYKTNNAPGIQAMPQ